MLVFFSCLASPTSRYETSSLLAERVFCRCVPFIIFTHLRFFLVLGLEFVVELSFFIYPNALFLASEQLTVCVCSLLMLLYYTQTRCKTTSASEILLQIAGKWTVLVPRSHAPPSSRGLPSASA
ncbi:hypothetical protein C8R45DRAFT_540196 [Mycena sanguinolenta]|nr:hypothetical protein C8R45DRAFT_540196 [Mycena sanguinolenta]